MSSTPSTSLWSQTCLRRKEGVVRGGAYDTVQLVYVTFLNKNVKNFRLLYL